MKRSSGFTLFELSLVLVIIGLLVGGIVGGNAMIHASNLRSVIGDAQKYKQSIIDFQDKYKALPGDFAGAEAIWGSDASCPNSPYSTTPHVATCNGNGDGLVGPTDMHNSFTGDREWHRVWQHLADAKMIDAKFSGISTAGNDLVSGINSPQSQIPNGSFTFLYIMQSNLPYTWPGTVGHYLIFGKSMSDHSWNVGSVISAPEAYSIDAKLDDGKPGLGSIRTAPNAGGSADCTSNVTDASTATYTTSGTNEACNLLFSTGM